MSKKETYHSENGKIVSKTTKTDTAGGGSKTVVQKAEMGFLSPHATEIISTTTTDKHGNSSTKHK